MASFVGMTDLSALNAFLQAGARQDIEKCLDIVFISRNQPSEAAEACVSSLQSVLSVEDDDQAAQLRVACLACISCVLKSGDIASLADLFSQHGGEVNPKLTKLVGQIVQSRMEAWQEAAYNSRVSLPRLVDIDWTVHLKRTSSQVSNMEIPSLFLRLDIEDDQGSEGPSASLSHSVGTAATSESDKSDSQSLLPGVRTVDVELSAEALETMLDGLWRIRDQLAAMG